MQHSMIWGIWYRKGAQQFSCPIGVECCPSQLPRHFLLSPLINSSLLESSPAPPGGPGPLHYHDWVVSWNSKGKAMRMTSKGKVSWQAFGPWATLPGCRAWAGHSARPG